jgi:hypothetical protein
VTLYYSATAADDVGCGMSFTATNATAANGASLATAADNHAVLIDGRKGNVTAGSASFVITTTATSALNAQYRTVSNGTCSFLAGSSIIVQVY